MTADSPAPAGLPDSPPSRLDSWKEIAAYLGRHVTTVRRWEKTESLPVHRHQHDRLGSVYAFPHEIDAWWRARRPDRGAEPAKGIFPFISPPSPPVTSVEPPGGHPMPAAPLQVRSGSRTRGVGAAAAALVLVALVWAGRGLPGRPAGSRPAAPSIAVLPLETLSGDPDQAALADAVTDALIGQLAQIPALRVLSRTPVMSDQGSGRRPLPESANALGVDAVLRGSLQRSGARVRIGLRLVNGQTDEHLWVRDYEREWRDGLVLQTDIARAVSEEIRVLLAAEAQARTAPRPRVATAAYKDYLIGRYYLWRDSDETLERAIVHFTRATALEPGFAAAYASLAHAWWKRGMWGRIGLAAAEAPARVAAERAWRLDPALPEVYVAQADLARLYDRDLVTAERLVQRALTLDPDHLDAHYAYGLVLMTAGRSAEAIAHMKAAERLDPFLPAVQSDLGRVLYRAGRFDEALVHLARALELEPAMARVMNHRIGEVYEQMGRYEDALAAFEQSEGRDAQYAIARTFARMGRRSEADRLLGRLTDSSADPGLAASIYAALDDRDRAFELLFAAVERGAAPRFLPVEPAFALLRSDPRWAELIQQIRSRG
jgi:TolB-like protein/Tfp pilus assembly protein PilF